MMSYEFRQHETVAGQSGDGSTEGSAMSPALSLHQGPNSIRSTHRDISWTSDRNMASPQRVKGRSRRFIPSGLVVYLSLFGASPKSLMKANEREDLDLPRPHLTSHSITAP